MYLLIQNDGICDFQALTTLGLSSTRNNSNCIGQFGSGTKQSICLLLRHKISPTIFLGNLKLQFATKTIEVNTIDGQHQAEKVQVQLSGKENNKSVSRTEETGFVLDFGAIDWTEPYMAIREFVSNAIDAAIKLYNDPTKIHIEIVQDPKKVRAKSNTTRVYIPATTEILEAFTYLPKRFLQLNPVEKLSDKILPKNNRNTIQDNHGPVFYKKGVMAGEKDRCQSLFDYNIHDIRLDESRNVDLGSVDWYAAKTFIEEAGVQHFVRILQNVNKELYETQNFSRYTLCVESGTTAYSNIQNNIKQAFYSLYPANAVIAQSSNHLLEIVRSKGYFPVVIDNDIWYGVLRHYKIPDMFDLLDENEKEGRIILPVNENVLTLTTLLWSRLKAGGFTYGKNIPDIYLFDQLDQNGTIVFGFQMKEAIYISKQISDNDNDLLRQTILEELCHYITGALDFSRDFQNFIIKIALRGLN